MRGRCVSATAVFLLGLFPALAQAQSYDSCPGFWSEGIHLKIDCVEALFSASPAHFTFSSVPPGNGFALGGVLESKTHFVSPSVALPNLNLMCPDIRNTVPNYADATRQRLGDHENSYLCVEDPNPPPKQKLNTASVTLKDYQVAIAGSTNGSWYTTGSFSWLPLHYTQFTKNGVVYQKLGPLLTHQVFGIQFYGTHRNVQNLNFYGESATSAATQYAFKQTETYEGSIARLPLTTWLRAEGQVEHRQISLPQDTASNSVQSNFGEATAPGIFVQPGFLHSALAADTDATWISEPANPKETVDANPVPVSLIKHRFVFRAQNRAGYEWYHDLNTGHYSFGQFAFTGDESIRLGAVFLKFIDNKPGSTAFPFLRFLCGGAGHEATVEKTGPNGKPVKVKEESFKPKDVCDFGQLDFKTRLVFSQTGAANVVPFYYQPTLGGSDIESRVSLRGYPDYRFRGNDLALVQIEYTKSIQVLDPVGIYTFYDGGSAALAGQSLGAARYRQDGGVGATVRLQGKIVLRAYAAMGAGHGVHLGYNLEKLF